ncbi:transcriptional regulator [Yersinia frederiksenii]|uniref:helix-turn-helix domain-containing protein n=1 Tax=Yersinia frederiksenii TaxID=29484 RepID=UPI000B493AF3|nr:helix-turn-helix transcriptional regulator [Yersinia frederiksenii]OWF73304.1 transcriptional regulator [Yersinia frederiksenii]
MSICTQGEKLKLMRESERLNRREMSELVDIPYGSMTGYELERMKMTLEVGMKIFNHPRFKKYMMWFMTGDISPESGQIAPALAHYGQSETISCPSDKKIG